MSKDELLCYFALSYFLFLHIIVFITLHLRLVITQILMGLAYKNDEQITISQQEGSNYF